MTGLLAVLVGCGRVEASALRGLAFDSSGHLFAADHERGCVYKFNPDGSRTIYASGLTHPLGLAFDADGNLFVGAVGHKGAHDGKIYKLTAAGAKTIFATVVSPTSMAFDRERSLFVSDSGKNAILRFTAAGKKSVFASGISQPEGPAFDREGNLFVSSFKSGTIIKFTPDGAKTTFASDLKGPLVLAFDRTGNLYVSDLASSTIWKFTPDGRKTSFATDVGAEGVACDSSGNLFVSDTKTGTILKYSPDGTSNTFASPALTSPDGKWVYNESEDHPEVRAAGTGEVALDLSDQTGGNGFGSATVVWAPDSRRFAFNYGQGRTRSVSLYQLREDKWTAIESPDDDEQIGKALDGAIAAELKTAGASSKAELRLIAQNLRVIDWAGPNTATLSASTTQNLQSRDLFFSANFIFTLTFDQAGEWKISKTHRPTEKELKMESGEE